jgi:HEAT repeat protein
MGFRTSSSALALAICLGTLGTAAAQGGKDAKGEADRVDRQSVDELVKTLQSTDASPEKQGEREVAERELVSRKKASIAPLVNMLDRTTNADARAAGVRILRKIGDPAPAVTLLKLYQDSSQPVELRCDAAMALGESKSVNAIPALIEGLNDTTSLKVCESARNALESMGAAAEDKVASAYLSERAKKKEARENILFRLLLVLGKVGGPKAREALVAALRSNDPKDPHAVALRHHAAIGLGLTKDNLAIEPLIQALEIEREFNIAKYIARSLETITDEHFPPAGSRWRAWWESNKERILTPKNRYNPLPKTGLPPDKKKDDK